MRSSASALQLALVEVAVAAAAGTKQTVHAEVYLVPVQENLEHLAALRQHTVALAELRVWSSRGRVMRPECEVSSPENSRFHLRLQLVAQRLHPLGIRRWPVLMLVASLPGTTS